MDGTNEFTHRLKVLREEFGYSRPQFAEELDIAYSTYYAYESGRYVPTLNILIKIATRFNVSLDWLCGIKETRTKTSEVNDVSEVLKNLLIESNNGRKIEVVISTSGLM